MPDRLDRRSDRPAYRQIADRLAAAIYAGDLAPGQQLPSETELIARYGSSRGTVRQAVAELRAQGLVEVEHGRGAFVRRRPPIRRLSQDRFARRHRDGGRAAFLAEAEAEHRRATVEVLELGVAEPDDPAVRAWLRLDADAVLFRRHRRYLADDEPVELATSWLPYELVEGTDIEQENTGPGGIYARLEDAGERLQRFTEEVTARMPLPEEARQLELPPGVPVFRLVRVAFTEDDQPVEACDTIIAADRYVLSYELPAR